MSHTPGPWRVVSKLVGPLHIEDSVGDPIAHVGHDDFKICSDNAELIAAAPDLLAAAETLLDWYDHDNFKMTMHSIQAFRDVVKKAKP